MLACAQGNIHQSYCQYSCHANKQKASVMIVYNLSIGCFLLEQYAYRREMASAPLPRVTGAQPHPVLGSFIVKALGLIGGRAHQEIARRNLDQPQTLPHPQINVAGINPHLRVAHLPLPALAPQAAGGQRQGVQVQGVAGWPRRLGSRLEVRQSPE